MASVHITPASKINAVVEDGNPLSRSKNELSINISHHCQK
ncbi:protein of unknown function [Xenorhabdus doucetiae]|uniref:Uncharacterized protein n=1 Tax=Xenorhabdus doucetiae TaxID=351671 RepID=A0A068QXJ6_9GAMM|nr:protein of unknown function [Xenorhabdus doucetiae]